MNNSLRENSSQEQVTVGTEGTPLQSSCDIADAPQTGHNQPATATGHVPVEKTDGPIREQSMDTVCRSKHSKRPPGKFTYPQLGRDLIQF